MYWFFVHSGAYYWIIDWEAHFNLDEKKNFDAALRDKKYPMSKLDYERGLKEFRNGIPTMTSEFFPRYRDGQSAKVVSTEAIKNLFWEGNNGEYQKLSTAMEESLSFDRVYSEELIQLRCRLSYMLPKFYVNFDRKIFMHMVNGRSYEGVVPDGWWGTHCDFEHMIPISHRYWSGNANIDLWAVTKFSNFD